mgnify:CR=1 FL=1
MILEDRIDAFHKLGVICSHPDTMDLFHDTVQRASQNNPWFTVDNIKFSILALSQILDAKLLYSWVSSYNMIDQNKKIGVIISSNIPFVGFFDFLCVLLSGNIFIGQLSSSNEILLPYLSSILLKLNSEFSKFIFFNKQIQDIDLLIATGNDNSAHYFEYKYAHLTKIIRRNRTSIAILDGLESENHYNSLANDVYRYFGLGCRNVSKLFVPKNFNFKKIKEVFQNYKIFTPTVDYLDNYQYQKNLNIINDFDYIDLNNLLLVQSDQIDSPISVLYYQYYDDIESLIILLEKCRNQIQCIVSNNHVFRDSIPFGLSQNPTLYDYPDGVDVMDFLTSN